MHIAYSYEQCTYECCDRKDKNPFIYTPLIIACSYRHKSVAIRKTKPTYF